MTYASEKSYHYWGYENSGYKAGDPSVDQNIPFNETEKFPPPKGKYTHERKNVYSSRTPKTIFTKALEAGEGPIGPMVFKDPFLLLSIFTHRVVGGVWGTGTGTLLGDFTDIDDDLSLWIQYHIHDQVSTNHLNRLLTGCDITEYKLMMKAGELLMEDATIKSVAFANNTQVMSLADTFHDQEFGSGIGGFAEWDDSGLLGTGKRSSADIVIHLDDAVITGLDIQEAELILSFPKGSKQLANSLEQGLRWLDIIDFTLTITGALGDLTEILESEKKYSDKTLRTLKFYIDDTVSEEKLITVTNVYVEDHSIVEITPINEIVEGTLTLKGGEGFAASYSGSFVDRPDPSILVPSTP